MKSFSLWLTEARKNPEQNPKISVYEALLKYKDDPDIYISFTQDLSRKDDNNKNGAKIGINPKSDFMTTPLAIYTLPLKLAWKYYDLDSEKSVKKAINIFCNQNPYIWVLRNNHKPTFIENMHSDYTSKNYDKDIITMKKIFFDSYNAKKEIQKERFATNDNSKDGIEQWERIFEKSLNQKWTKLVQRALAEATPVNPIKAFWAISMELGFVLAEGNGKKSTAQWNKILRECGYSGFCDHGDSYIHQAEPIQAIFLSKDTFTVVEKVLNKDYTEITFIKNFEDVISFAENNPNELSYLIVDMFGDGFPTGNKYYKVKDGAMDDIAKEGSQEEWVKFLRVVKKQIHKLIPMKAKSIMNLVTKLIDKYKLHGIVDSAWEDN